jgi:2-amino-4-hydroxy-6-hydroxymethyldihydropteridine diphosphokinase
MFASMEEKDLYLLLGTNLGDRVANLDNARTAIQKEIGHIRSASRLYASKAWGITNQPDFLNQVVVLSATGKAVQLLTKIIRIEDQLGRIRTDKWGPRLIDIDILFYGDEIISTTELIVPHPHLEQRMFTLKPLAEVGGDKVHPVSGRTVDQLLRDCPDTGEVWLA